MCYFKKIYKILRNNYNYDNNALFYTKLLSFTLVLYIYRRIKRGRKKQNFRYLTRIQRNEIK